MADKTPQIEFSINRFVYLGHIQIFSGILTFILFISVVIGFGNVFSLFFLITLIAFMVLTLFGFSIIYSSDYYVNSLVNQQYPHDLDERDLNHDAFIVIHSMGDHGFGLYAGFDNLIKHYTKEKYPFKIYHCYNPDDFKKSLKNDKAKYIWIFGHGWRGGITFKWTKKSGDPILLRSKKTQYAYAQLLNEKEIYPKKSFVAQFHCNHIEKTFAYNITLCEILLESHHKSKYYVTNGLNNHFSIWFATRKLMSEVKRDKIVDSDIRNNPDIDSCRC